MKTIVTMISAATLAVVSSTVLAWGWGPYADGYNGYYAPYGYGFPATGSLSEEQQQAIAAQQKLLAEQQARLIENMQKAQQQAAEFYASQPAPAFAAAPAAFGEDPFLRQMDAMREQMDAMHEARLKDMDARMEATRNASDFYARPPFPGFADEPAFADSYDDEAYLRQLEAERAARRKAFEARREEARKAFEARRQAAEERYKARRQERSAPADAPAGV